MDGQLTAQIAGGFAPLVTGTPFQPTTGMEGIPFFGGGPMGTAAQVFLSPYVRQVMGNYSMAPMGLGHDQNVYDALRRQQFTREYRDALRQTADAERGNYMRTFRGLAAISGTPWGAEQRRAAGSLADMAVSAAPILAEVAPELMDQLGGMRGSATVMASRMMMGGRYAIDPVTGRMGQSPETVSTMAKGIFRDFYEGKDIAQMKGITAGQLGSLHDELSRRGMIAGPQESLGTRTRMTLADMQRDQPDLLMKAAANQKVTLPGDLSKVSAEDLDKLRLDPSVADRLRSFDTERVKRSLKTYVGVVGAMRDIFGDIGRPNAPMSELIQGLEAMTQGGVGRLDTGRMNLMVRTTHELARMNGMGLDGAMAIQQHAASRAQALGIDPVHAIQAAQGGMAFSGAYRASGGAAVSAWGRYNADQMTQLDTNLRVAAAASEQSNRLGLIMRMRERVGEFQKGSELEALATAVSHGQTEYTYQDAKTGKTQAKSTMVSGDDFFRLMTNARDAQGRSLGFNEAALTRMMGQRQTNEEFIERYGIANQARRQQAQESRVWEAGRISETVAERLRAAGMDDGKAIQVSEQVRENIAKRVGQMTDAQFADGRTRTDTMARIMREELGKTEAGSFLQQKGMNTQAFYKLAAEETYGHINQSIQLDPTRRGFGNWQNLRATMNERTLEQGDRNATQARFNAMTTDALAPLGHGTMLQRGIQALQDAKEGTDPLEVLAQAMGGVRKDDIAKGLQSPMQRVAAQQKRLKELQGTYERAETSDARQRALEQIETQRQSLQAEVAQLTKTATNYGIYTDKMAIGQADVDRARQSWDAMTTGIRDTAGLAGAFGWKVSEQEKASIRSRTLDSKEVRALIPGAQTREDIARELFIRREGQKAADAVTDEQAKQFQAQHLDQFATVTDAKKALQMQHRRARAEALRVPGAISSAQVEATLQSKIAPEEAEDVVLMGRSAVPTAPTDAEVEKIRKSRSTAGREVTTAEARMLAEAELRARRMGIAEVDIQRQLPRAGQGRNAAEAQLRAINLAIEGRFAEQLDVNKIDLSTMDSKERDRIRDGAKRWLGKDTVNDGDMKNFIMQERHQDQQQKLKEFWASDSGAVFRQNVNKAMAAADDLGTRFIMNKEMVDRLGPQGLQDYQQLMGQQQELKVLALKYASGDLSRLMMGDLNIGRSTQTDRTKYAQVRERVDRLWQGIAQSEQGMARGIGAEGRQWGTTQREAEEAAWRLMEFKVPSKLPGGGAVPDDLQKLARRSFGELSDAERKQLLESKLFTDEQRKQYRDMVAGVQITQKLSVPGAQALQEFKDSREQVRAEAKTLGVSEDQLVQAMRTRDLGLDNKQLDEIRSQRDRFNKANAEATAAQSRLEQLNKDIVGKTGQQRLAIEDEIARQSQALKTAQGTVADARSAVQPFLDRTGYGSAESLFQRADQPKGGPQIPGLKVLSTAEEQDTLRVQEAYDAYQAKKLDRSAKPEEVAAAKKAFEDIAGGMRKTMTDRGYTDAEKFVQAFKDRKLVTQGRLAGLTGDVEKYETSKLQADQARAAAGTKTIDEALQGLAPAERMSKIAERYREMETMSGEQLSARLFQAYGLDTVAERGSVERTAQNLQGRDERQLARSLASGAEFLGQFAAAGAQSKLDAVDKTTDKTTQDALTDEARRLRESRTDALLVMHDDYRKIRDDKNLSEADRDKAYEKFRKDYGVGEGNDWSIFESKMDSQIRSGMIEKLKDAKLSRGQALEAGMATVSAGGPEAIKQIQASQAPQRMTIDGTLTIKANGQGDVAAHGGVAPY